MIQPRVQPAGSASQSPTLVKGVVAVPELLTSEIVTQTVLRLHEGVLPILNHRDSWKVPPEVIVTMERLIAIVDLVRSPSGGWPADREATPENLLPYVMDEAMDILEALEQSLTQSGLPTSHPFAPLQKLLHDRLILADAIAHFLWGIARSSVDTMQLLGGIPAECFQPGQDWTPGILRLMAIFTIQTPTSHWVLDLVTAEPPLPELHRDTFLRWSGTPVFWVEAFLQSLERSIQEATPLLQGLLDHPIASDIIVPGQPWQKGHLKLDLSFTFAPHAVKPSLALRTPSVTFSPNLSLPSQWEDYQFTLSPSPSAPYASEAHPDVGSNLTRSNFVSSPFMGFAPDVVEQASRSDRSEPEHSGHSEPEHSDHDRSGLEHSEQGHLEQETEFIEVESFAALFQDLPSTIPSPDRLASAAEEELEEDWTIENWPIETAMSPIPQISGEPDEHDREGDLFGAWEIEPRKEESKEEESGEPRPDFEIVLGEDLKDTVVTVIPETLGQHTKSDRFESWNLEQWKIRWIPSEERSPQAIGTDGLQLPRRYYVKHLLQSFSQKGEVTRPEPDKQQRLLDLVDLACQALTPPDPPPTLLNTQFVFGESTVADLIQRLTWFLIRDSYALTCLLSGINAQILQPEWGWESGILRLLPILQLQTDSSSEQLVSEQLISEQVIGQAILGQSISPSIDLQIDLSTGSPAPLETLLVLPDILINIEGTDWQDTRAPVFQFRTELLSRLQQLLPELEVLRSPVPVELAQPNQTWQPATLQIQFELGFQA